MDDKYKIDLSKKDLRISNTIPLTTTNGNIITNNEDSLTIGNSGPVLLEDITLLDKLTHFDRERIPERVVHAKGAGAFGTFENYHNQSELTCADFLQRPNEKINALIRFSTVIGSKGSADTARDPRGFAVKLYTKQGNLDIVGNHIPVFFIRDSIKFADLIHSLKPNPITNVRDPQRFWDFISLTPESMHMIMWVYSDTGTIKSFRKINGFGVNTYVWVNSQNKRRFIKYHWICKQEIETIDAKEAERLAGSDQDVAVKDLFNAIERKEYPQWELCIQYMDEEKAKTLDFDILDDTKIWPEEQFPLIKIGMLTLNKNPQNFFNQIEQAAFCPGNIVKGIEFSNDKMLQGRTFSYIDTQKHRIGANFMQLPVNKPLFEHNNNQDGPMSYHFNPSDINYSPSNFTNRVNKVYIGPPVSGITQRKQIIKEDNFSQANEKYMSYTETEKEHLIYNLASELKYVTPIIQDKILALFKQVNEDLFKRVKKAIS